MASHFIKWCITAPAEPHVPLSWDAYCTDLLQQQFKCVKCYATRNGDAFLHLETPQELTDVAATVQRWIGAPGWSIGVHANPTTFFTNAMYDATDASYTWIRDLASVSDEGKASIDMFHTQSDHIFGSRATSHETLAFAYGWGVSEADMLAKFKVGTNDTDTTLCTHTVRRVCRGTSHVYCLTGHMPEQVLTFNRQWSELRLHVDCQWLRNITITGLPAGTEVELHMNGFAAMVSTNGVLDMSIAAASPIGKCCTHTPFSVSQAAFAKRVFGIDLFRTCLWVYNMHILSVCRAADGTWNQCIAPAGTLHFKMEAAVIVIPNLGDINDMCPPGFTTAPTVGIIDRRGELSSDAKLELSDLW